MFLADLHIHSSYSRATSRDCVPEYLELWARRKGLDLIGTGDFTHPAWRAELREKLEPAEEGLYVLKETFRQDDLLGGKLTRPRFVVTGEISCIYKKNDKVRKVHNVILLPGLEEAEALARRLEEVGNLHSDGRWTAVTCWKSRWRSVLRLSLSRPISGHLIFPCLGNIPASTPSRNASGI